MESINLDKFQKNLKMNSKKLTEQDQVSLDVLFEKPFMRKYTKFSTFDEFLSAGNFIISSQKDFEDIPDADMNNHVRKSTRFSSWKEMLITASKEYVLKKLGF